jgi:hypothetical protein
MANPRGTPQNLQAHRFKPGQSGNPGGKPVGARNAISADFLKALAAHFRAHGEEAIERACKEDPLGYVRVVASILPKELVVEQRPLEGLSDEELAAAIAELRARLVGAPSAGAGTAAPGRTKSTDSI